MATSLSHRSIEVHPGQALALATAPGESLRVVRGLVWATTTGSGDDLWLREGHRHMLERGGVTVIEAPRGAQVELSPAAALGPLGVWASLLRALRARAGGGTP